MTRTLPTCVLLAFAPAACAAGDHAPSPTPYVLGAFAWIGERDDGSACGRSGSAWNTVTFDRGTCTHVAVLPELESGAGEIRVL